MFSLLFPVNRGEGHEKTGAGVVGKLKGVGAAETESQFLKLRLLFVALVGRAVDLEQRILAEESGNLLDQFHGIRNCSRGDNLKMMSVILR